MQISSLSLLPQSPKTQMPTHLKFTKVLMLLKFFTTHALQTFNNFYIHKNLCVFDPHVGDTACQIRAYQMILLQSERYKCEQNMVKNKISSLKEILGRLESDFNFYKKLDTTRQTSFDHYTTLETFIFEKNYHFELTELEMFLIQSFILTKYKTLSKENGPIINYNLLMEDLDVSKHTARCLVHKYQRDISKYSCDFIFSLSDKLPSPPISKNILEKLKHSDDEGRTVLPCYWVMQIIVAHMKSFLPNLLFIVERMHVEKLVDTLFLPFKVTASKIEIQDADSIVDSDTYFVVRGVSCHKNQSKKHFIEHVLKLGLEKVLLLNCASHPQYTGKKLEYLNNNPFNSEALAADAHESISLENKFLMDQRKGQNLGFSKDNPLFYFITHMSCDTIGNQVDILSMLPKIQENSIIY